MVYSGIALVTGVLCHLPSTWLQQNLVPVLIAGLFMAITLRYAKRDPRGLAHFGIELGGLFDPPAKATGFFTDLWNLLERALPRMARSLLVASALALSVFPVFALGFYWWVAPGRAFAWSGLEGLPSFGLAQLVLIALPEEMLFRGYIQTRLGDAFPATRRVLGAQMSLPAWLLQALLFAILHTIATPDPYRLLVFVPGLWFGWARALFRGIGVSVWLHAMSNIFSMLLIRGFFP